MIEFLSAPARGKILLGGLAVLLFLCAGLAVSAVYYHGRFQAEREAHQASKAEYAGRLALAETANNILLQDQQASKAVISGLRLQAKKTMAALNLAARAAAARAVISNGAKSVPANPEEVVDHATSREIIRHLNTALRRR